MVQHSRNFARTTDFIPQPEASRLDVSSQDIAGISERADRVARYGILVQVITYYEVFLTGILTDLINSRWPRTSQVTIKIRPSDLPLNDLSDYLKASVVSAEVNSVIAEGYSKRHARVNRLLNSYGFPEPVQNADRKSFVTASCEIRNCIVHNGGKVDQRAKDALEALFPNVALESQFELDEINLWKLLGAVRDDARAIDFALRKQMSDRRVARISKRKRAAARRKAVNLAQKQARNTPQV